MLRAIIIGALTFASSIICLSSAALAQNATADPLPSWNEGATKQKIIEFVKATTTDGSPDFVPVSQRIATFDQDGTLLVEQPNYAEFLFSFAQVKSLAAEHQDWKSKQPFKAILEDDARAIVNFTSKDIEKILGATHSGMTTDAFAKMVKDWVKKTKHPRFEKPYTELFYQPMLEVMSYLRRSGFQTYIVTGSGQGFVRAYSEDVWGVPPQQVVGTPGKTKYTYTEGGKPELMKLPDMFLIDDKEGKPVSINLMIGRHPIAAFGNSTGDQQMLEWAQSGSGNRLMMLVHHDDTDREYMYGAYSKIGPFPDTLMQTANQRGWVVISMKDDWKRVFSW